MARIRTIKPEFWTDEKLAAWPRDARLLYIGLWNFADDYGVVKANPVWLRSQIFPYDDISVSVITEWIGLIEGSRRAHTFLNQGEKYLFLPYFVTHQLINRRSIWRNPKPPEELLKLVDFTPESQHLPILSEGSVSVHGVITEGSQPLSGSGSGSGDQDPDQSNANTKTPLATLGPQGGTSKRVRNEKVTDTEKFTLPSLEELIAYKAEKGLDNFDPERFIDYYTSIGWVVGGGGKKMKDWKSASRNWNRRPLPEVMKGNSNGLPTGSRPHRLDGNAEQRADLAVRLARFSEGSRR